MTAPRLKTSFVCALAVAALLLSTSAVRAQSGCATDLTAENVACQTQNCEGAIQIQYPVNPGYGWIYLWSTYAYCCNIGVPTYYQIGMCLAPVKEDPTRAASRAGETYAWIRGCDGTYFLAVLPA
jgi:hypothetical protein